MKKFLFLFFGIIASVKSFSQMPDLLPIKSPNAYSMGIFGDIPVSYFTGTPNISIPIYTLKSGNISLPISLDYHPALVKPNEHPGWVGLGWNLSCTGAITRQQNGFDDEYNGTDYSNSTPYYPATGSNGSTLINSLDTPGEMKYYGIRWWETDLQADEFSFNFLGYSGKFMYTPNGWQCISDQNIKVEDTTFFAPNEVLILLNNQLYGGGNIFTNSDNQNRQFKEFILTTEDGTKYYFGGDDAVEFISNYCEFVYGFEANAWYLKKVVDMNGNEVNFTYHRYNPICRLSYYWSNTYSSFSYAFNNLLHKNIQGSNWSFHSTITTQSHGGFAIYPVYLSEITSDNVKISFKTSRSNELKYERRYLEKYNDSDQSYFHPQMAYWTDSLRWEQLNRIEVKDNASTIKRRFTFQYGNLPTERLKLSSLAEIGDANVQAYKYTFDYNPMSDNYNHQWPGYGGDQTDAWGYFNARSVENAQPGVDIIKILKSPMSVVDFNVTSLGLLNQITYPTGGYSKFYWEPNDYGQTMKGGSLVSGFGFTGGARIKKIENFTENGATPITKEYFYNLNYNGGGTTSSGILNGEPQFAFSVSNREGFYYDVASLTSLVNYNPAGNGSHIGYTEVAEKDGRGAYTIYKYTNYGTEDGHKDESPGQLITGWLESEDTYYPYSSLEVERGKLKTITAYSSINTPVDITTFEYSTDASRKNKFIKRYKITNTVAGDNNMTLVFSVCLKDYQYRFKPISKTHTRYDINGQNPITTTYSYLYNDRDQLTTESESTSDDQIIQKYTLYPSQYAAGTTFLDNLKTNFVYNVPVEEVTVKKSATAANIIEGTAYTYYPGGKGLVDKEYKLEMTSSGKSIPLSQFKFSNTTTGVLPNPLASYGAYAKDGKYKEQLAYTYTPDNKGNPLVITPVNNTPISCIWGYNAKNLVAKVINAMDSKVAYTGFENTSDKGNWTYSSQINTVVKSRTGIGCYSLSWGPITKSLAAGTYRLQFWSKGTVTVTGGTITDLVTSSPDVNGWTFYEKEIKLTATTTLTLSNTSVTMIDELRVFPNDAQMVTYTYDPVYGLTSETDANHVTTYYEYDDFGRLKSIKDQDGNIVQNFEYHFKTGN